MNKVEIQNNTMLDKIIALMPAGLAGIYFFGLRALILICTFTVFCLLFECLWKKFVIKTDEVDVFEAIVTGLLLSYIMPPLFPLWLVPVVSAVATILIKNIISLKWTFNSAAAGKLFVVAMLGSYAKWFISPSVLGFDSAGASTVLMLVKNGDFASLAPALDVIFGASAGTVGQVCTILILIGGIYLILKKVVSFVFPAAFIGSVMVLTFAFAPEKNIVTMLSFMAYNIFGGGLLLASFFMADALPTTALGKVITGIIGGIVVSAIRLFGILPDGSMHAVLIMNVVSPIIEKLTIPLPTEDAITE